MSPLVNVLLTALHGLTFRSYQGGDLLSLAAKYLRIPIREANTRDIVTATRSEEVMNRLARFLKGVLVQPKPAVSNGGIRWPRGKKISGLVMAAGHERFPDDSGVEQTVAVSMQSIPSCSYVCLLLYRHTFTRSTTTMLKILMFLVFELVLRLYFLRKSCQFFPAKCTGNAWRKISSESSSLLPQHHPIEDWTLSGELWPM